MTFTAHVKDMKKYSKKEFLERMSEIYDQACKSKAKIYQYVIIYHLDLTPAQRKLWKKNKKKES